MVINERRLSTWGEILLSVDEWIGCQWSGCQWMSALTSIKSTSAGRGNPFEVKACVSACLWRFLSASLPGSRFAPLDNVINEGLLTACGMSLNTAE